MHLSDNHTTAFHPARNGPLFSDGDALADAPIYYPHLPKSIRAGKQNFQTDKFAK